MSELGKGERLFNEFPPVSTEEWEEKIKADLKGADYEKTLIWKTNEGFNVKPYYRQEDLKNFDYLEGVPGQFPFIRGNKKDKNTWYIRQDIEADDLKKANEKARILVNKGVNSIGFILNKDALFTKDDISKLLEGLPINELEINFNAGYGALTFVKAFNEYLENKPSFSGSFVFDPLMCIAKSGRFCSANPISDATEMVNATKQLSNFRSLTIRGDVFENAGSSIVQELGFSLAVGNEYLSELTESGISTNDAAKAIKFQFATGSNYFMEIAKIRAARLLWATIVKQYKPENEQVCLANIHAVTSDWNKTIYDPYVNLLRTQTEAMSSVLGGVDSMTVKAFNAVYEKPTEFSGRIARNQQLLLKEESHFDKVVDPAAGSYYIESLTDSIAEEAWKLFLEVEEKGGFIQAFKSGFIQNIIKETAQKRDIDIANRKENFLGVNQFPNFNEHIEKELPAEVFEKPTFSDVIAEPLIKYRGAMAFEALRYKTDIYSKSNKRPLAFMLTIGNLAMRKARAQFSCNFFAVAGFDVQDNNGFDSVEEGINEAIKANADIIVICSSDEEYTTFAPETQKLAGDTLVVVAGYPKAIMDDLKAAGIKYFIHVKSNLLETLSGFQKDIGIK